MGLRGHARLNAMTRRSLLNALALNGLSAETPKPNIVLYIADDLGYDFTGCNGNRAIQTPHIDAFAQQGLRFTQAYAASPTCSPSRAILYTGLHSARNGLMGNHTGAKPGVQSIAHYLKPLGYRVMLVHKTHVKPPEVFDFEYVSAALPPRPDRDRRYRMEGLDLEQVDTLLAKHPKQQPLCMIVADSSPHVVWEKNQRYDPAKLPVPPNMVDTPLTRRALANYYEDTTTADRNFGAVLASLDEHGFGDNTLVVFTADQGPEWPKAKWTVYDAGLRVPFVVRWPGKVAAGAVTSAMISHVDMTPTLVDLAGGTAPTGLDGRSYRSVLLGRAKEFRTEIYASHSGDGAMNMSPQRGLRDRRYKYVLNLHPERQWTTHFTKVGGVPESHKSVYDTWLEKARMEPATAKLIDIIERHPREELYDTQTDPYELNNLAGRPGQRGRLERMRARVSELRKQLNDPEE